MPAPFGGLKVIGLGRKNATQSGTASLDGRGRVATGVRVQGCGKVHLDRLAVTGCTGVGLAYTGRGGDRFADSGSVTRSSFLRCAEI
jgi:hypothetical protein